mgnify:FL=1
MIKNIRNNLEIELPGIKSWNRMTVEPMQDSRTINEKIINYKEWSSKENVKNMKKAAVLVCFFKKNNEYYFPLIKRPMHERNHPGQIALPVGSMEIYEALMTTALREAFEEVGIQPNDVDVIGEMTPLPVPVSRYLIYPFIGITEVEPKWILNKKEVDELIVLKFLDLISSDNGYYEEWNLKDKMLKVPIFKIMNVKIWGATAAILSELIDLSKDSI